MTRLYITAATGALSAESAPVGGGVAVIEALLPGLRERFEVTLVTPGRHPIRSLGRQILPVPTLAESNPERLLRLNAREYARFALEWETALEDYFEEIEPEGAVVLANDISEGPPFERLAARGFRQIAVFHVVVADFFAQRYLPVGAAAGARLWRAAERLRLARAAPGLARLVWRKEEAAARFADTCVVPSRPLADALAACYPGSGVEQRTRVIPWGVIGEADPSKRERRGETLELLGIDRNRFTIATLSRISPEKRIELLLRALARIERDSPSTARQLAVVIAGAPAYMGGERYLQHLHREAGRLRIVETAFPGYLSGDQKWDLLAAADLFASPSSYEAYGLTIAQSLASGTPALAAPHAGAKSIITPKIGWLADPTPQTWAAAIRRAHAEHPSTKHETRRQAAARWGAHRPVDHAAQQLARLIGQVGVTANLGVDT